MYALIVVLIVLAAIAAGATWALRATSPDNPTTIRRMFTFGLAAIGWLLMAAGVSGIVSNAIPVTSDIYRDTTFGMARALSYLAVGAPFALGLWKEISRSLTADNAAWKIALPIVSGIALIVGVVGTARSLVWLFGGTAAPEAVGELVAWVPLWIAAVRLERRHPTGDPSAVLIWSGIGLVTTAFASGALLWHLFGRALDVLTGATIAGGSGFDPVIEPAVWMVVGGVVWVLCWWADALHRPDSVPRRLFALIPGVTAGAIATIGALSSALFIVAEWYLGNPESSTWAGQLQPMPGLAATVVVGTAVWIHHRKVAAMPDPSDRAARVIMAGIGLGAAGIGVALIVASLVTRLGGATIAGDADITLGGVIATLVGGALWGSQWSVLQRRATSDPTELRRPSRRILVGVVLVVSLLTAIPGLIGVLYAVISNVLGDTGRPLSEALAAGLGALVSAGLIGGYHWTVWRHDRVAAPAPVTTAPRRVMVVTSGDPSAAMSRLSGEAQVWAWHRSDVPSGDGDVTAIENALATTEADFVLLVEQRDGHYEVIPLG